MTKFNSRQAWMDLKLPIVRAQFDRWIKDKRRLDNKTLEGMLKTFRRADPLRYSFEIETLTKQLRARVR